MTVDPIEGIEIRGGSFFTADGVVQYFLKIVIVKDWSMVSP